MASTNKTTYYELSQYVSADKPTYLVDYNGDMSKIDAGIHSAKAVADTNSVNIGDMTDLTTTAKTDLVSAINELDGEVATNTGNISTNTTNIDANTTAIGTLANLTTSAKNNLVASINEVDANCDSNTTAIGTLSNLTTTAKTDLVSAINEVDSKKDVYDTTETLTSELWENNPIYRKVYDVTFSGSNSLFIPANLSNCKIVRMFGIDVSTSASEFPIPSSRPAQPSYEMGLYYKGNTDEIVIETTGNVNRDGHTGWVCVEYYKENNN